MRQHLPPNACASSPHAAAILRATRCDVDVDHALPSSPSVKKGVRLGLPGVRSAAGTPASRISHAARSASYAQSGSAPSAPSFRRLRSSIGTAVL
eukprot:3076391-Pleurochrysis_carterae.AAC.1